jgi:hypothetical protein
VTAALYAADDRAYFAAGHAGRLCFGDPAAPALLLNVGADAYGCMWATDTPEGWDAAPVDTPVDRRQGGHGGILADSYLTERTLTFADGMVTAPSAAALTAARDRWLAALYTDLSGYVLFTALDEPGGPWSLWLRPTGAPKWLARDDRVAVWSWTWVADDPIKFGATAVYGPARLPSGTGDPGRTYAKTYPYGYGGGAARRDALLIANPAAAVGGDYAQALYTVTGPVPQPRITVSSGEWFALTADLGPLDTLTVDTAAGAAQVNGANRPDLIAVGATFPLVPPGGAEVRFRSATGGSDPAAALTVTTAPRRK